MIFQGVGAVAVEMPIPRVTYGTGDVFPLTRYMRMVGTFEGLKFARCTDKAKRR
jgi:hypothetical protein